MSQDTPELDRLKKQVNNWVEKQLKGFHPRKSTGNKILRDPIWGMILLSPLEITILDSPLIQRLRRIHQTGLVFLTYPSALHTRFDHSLGVLHCATRMTSIMNMRYISLGDLPIFSELHIQEIRLAALLHDVGHACLSHLTEPYFSDYPLIKFAKKELHKSKNVLPRDHELLSSLIVSCDAFIKYFDECSRSVFSGKIIDPRSTCYNISDMILGAPIENNPDRAYISGVINGAFDADKLDYIYRDSYFTGISLGTDIDRFIFGLSINKIPESESNVTGIVLDINAASSYDQLILSKVSLYTNVYNHQKVMATNVLIDQILRILKENPDIKIKGISMENPIDFLTLTDWDFLNENSKNSEIREIQKKIRLRDLPVRLLRISRKTLDAQILPVGLARIEEDSSERDSLQKSICRELSIETHGCDTIQICFPDQPTLPEKTDAYCRDFDGQIVSFNTISPLQWVDTYQDNKHMGYVFGPYTLASESYYNRIKHLMESEFNTKFNSKAAPKFLASVYHTGEKHATISQ